MADLSANSLWSNLDSAETSMLGPSYSYADAIKGPSSLGVGSNGSFSQLGRNAGAVVYYTEALITGDPPLGNQFFVNTGGVCSAPNGTVQPRYNYINNLSSGSAILPASMSELGADFNGLIPGVVQDIQGLNPLPLFSALAADANPPCVCMSCPTTSSGQVSRFVTKNLDPDLGGSKCTEVDASECMKSSESFSNQIGFVEKIPLLLAGLGILYFVFSGRK